MAIDNSSLLEISMKGQLFGQQAMNVFHYEVGGLSGPVAAVNVGQAWWNHVKATYRPLVGSGHGLAFMSVLVREVSVVAGEYAEYAVPAGERAGTGGAGSLGYMPPFVAAGIRLTVGSGLTRPGQKRIGGQDEADGNSSTWEAAFMIKLNDFGAVIGVPMVLGAPAAAMELTPIVVRKPAVGAAVTVWQEVTGYYANPQITSQVSRKIGRGA